MSDKADKFLQNTDDGAFMYVSNPELYKRLCGYVQSYADQQLKEVLDEITQEAIDEASFHRFKQEKMNMQKRWGFKVGAEWLLTHLKQTKG